MSQSHRQQPGLACEDCRRRKARCDRVRPSCGPCKDIGTSCRYVDKRPQRGPRKGQMMLLKNLVADLEQRLGERTRQQQPDYEIVSSDNSQKPDSIPNSFLLLEQDSALAETVPMTLSIDLENSNLSSTGYENPSLGTSSLGTSSLGTSSLGNNSLDDSSLWSNSLSSTSPEETAFTSSMLAGADISSLRALDGTHNNIISDQNFISDWLDGDGVLSPSETPSFKVMQSLGGPALSELMEADLDELYFDRVHPVSPNIHRRKYFAWARQKRRSASQMALQYAMRAVAAAVSAQYRPLSGILCAESRRVLEQMDINGTGNCSDTRIEQIQAWLLVAHWELLCSHEHQAMLTAGRAIRMVQMARLHDVDINFFPSSSLSGEEFFVKTEEQRRTFWLAYCFDRFCLMHIECPPSLQEESIRTRLPASEANFQNSQPIQMDFLSEALVRNGRTTLPHFAKCVVLNSLFSHCISHQRFAMSEAASNGSDSHKVWSKYAWLAMAVENRKGLLEQSLPSTTDVVDDPIFTFTTALAACAATNVYQSMAQSTAWTTVDHEEAVPPYKEQAFQAVSEFVRFINLMPRSISCFKAHPFLPTLIYRAARFLLDQYRSSSSITTTYSNQNSDLGVLLGALRDLEQVNNLSRSLLGKLEKDVSQLRNVGERHEGNDAQVQQQAIGQGTQR
ncbi:hypothetical protein K505DRAFT_375619 [Melanomma pulvis-pyrius CBS 109.77]|uniref:Zn(2)-C6 fungal-type domain-containing protein n=1 Tax=Melanomma pulvis-pyrius CBS 109.77 TaxID=1314802 RepID=A0A6A6X9T2_9PLEO|nr:hypothetical protein K505DRAFT_375619 [Melanomma pulvis-pyrius CBS 109.77]